MSFRFEAVVRNLDRVLIPVLVFYVTTVALQSYSRYKKRHKNIIIAIRLRATEKISFNLHFFKSGQSTKEGIEPVYNVVTTNNGPANS